MREIKFRIWDSGKNRWFHGDTDRRSQDIGTNAINLFGEVITMGEILRDQNDDNGISIDRLHELIPCQYTGLKDKNGVEIYEGDLLRHYNGLINELYEVKWSSEDTCYTVKLQGRFIDPEMSDPYTDEQIVQMQLTSDVKYLMVMYSLSAMSGEAEVIGNIYEGVLSEYANSDIIEQYGVQNDGSPQKGNQQSQQGSQSKRSYQKENRAGEQKESRS